MSTSKLNLSTKIYSTNISWNKGSSCTRLTIGFEEHIIKITKNNKDDIKSSDNLFSLFPPVFKSNNSLLISYSLISSLKAIKDQETIDLSIFVPHNSNEITLTLSKIKENSLLNKIRASSQVDVASIFSFITAQSEKERENFANSFFSFFSFLKATYTSIVFSSFSFPQEILEKASKFKKTLIKEYRNKIALLQKNSLDTREKEDELCLMNLKDDYSNIFNRATKNLKYFISIIFELFSDKLTEKHKEEEELLTRKSSGSTKISSSNSESSFNDEKIEFFSMKDIFLSDKETNTFLPLNSMSNIEYNIAQFMVRKFFETLIVEFFPKFCFMDKDNYDAIKIDTLYSIIVCLEEMKEFLLTEEENEMILDFLSYIKNAALNVELI